jgi:hypothetical protein
MRERSRISAMAVKAVDEPLPQAPAGVLSVEVPAAEVVITGQEVVFSTAAGVAPRRRAAGHPFLTRLWRVLAGSTNAPRRRPYSPPYYLECARLCREIDRL